MERNRCLDDQELMTVYNRPHFDTMESRHMKDCVICSEKFRNLVNSILSPSIKKTETPETSVD